MGQVCMLSCVFFILLTALALTVVALLTDNWYRVSTADHVNPDIRSNFNHHYGLWRLCYDDIPSDIASNDHYRKEGSCIFIYEELIKKKEGNLDKDTQLRIHLSRTVLGCSITAASLMLFAVLTLVCGLWPSVRRASRKGCLYFSAAVLLLLASMSGIASGVSFIAIRDLDNTTFRNHPVVPPAVPEYADQAYDWSFMLHWIATGLALLDSLLLLCMMRSSYLFVRDDKLDPLNEL